MCIAVFRDAELAWWGGKYLPEVNSYGRTVIAMVAIPSMINLPNSIAVSRLVCRCLEEPDGG